MAPLAAPSAVLHQTTWLRRLQEWTTFVIAVAAFSLSVVNWAQTNRQPAISLILPERLKIAQGLTEAWLYVQPSFLIDRKSDRTASLGSLYLHLHRADGQVPDPPLFWDETGQFTYDQKTGDQNYQYLSDPLPIVVTQDKPASPLILFASDTQALSPGRWDATLTAIQNDAEITERFCIKVNEADMRFVRLSSRSCTVPFVPE